MEKYKDSCLRLSHSALDGFDPLLVDILDGNVVAEELFRKQLNCVVDYVELLCIDSGDKEYQKFRNRTEQLKFMLETLDEQGYSNLLVAKIMRALCRQVDNPYPTKATNITEEQFFRVLEHIKAIEDNEEMKSKLIGDLQSLGYKSGLYIPLTKDGFIILKEVIEGMLGARKYNDSIEHLNDIIIRYNGLTKYEGIKELDGEVIEELEDITNNLKDLIDQENNKRLSLLGMPLFD